MVKKSHSPGIRKLFIVLFSILLFCGLGVAVFFTTQKQTGIFDVRNRASGPSGDVTLTLTTESFDRYIGDTFPVNVMLDTKGKAISGVALRFFYPFIGTSPELEVVDTDTGTAGVQIQPFVSALNMGVTVNSVYTQPTTNGNVFIDFTALSSAPEGVTTTQPTKIATIKMKAVREKQVDINHDPVQTKVTDKTTALDILQSVPTYAFKILKDAAPPIVTFLEPIDNFATTSASVKFAWKGEDNPKRPPETVPALTYKYRFDGGAWSAAVTDTTVTKAFVHGTHTMEVQGIDAMGNAVLANWPKKTVTVHLTPHITYISAFSSTKCFPGNNKCYADINSTSCNMSVNPQRSCPDGYTCANKNGPCVCPVGATCMCRDAMGADGVCSLSEGTSGTAEATVITINGYNFGTTGGSISFGKNASNGVKWLTGAATILSWSDTKIVAIVGYTEIPDGNLVVSSNTYSVAPHNAGISNAVAFTLETKIRLSFPLQGIAQDRGERKINVFITGPSGYQYSQTDVPTVWDTTKSLYTAVIGPLPRTGFTNGAATYTIAIKDGSRLRRLYKANTLWIGWWNVIEKKAATDTMILADFNADNKLDITDYGLLMSQMKALTNAVTDANRIYDLNGDGIIDIVDAALVQTNYTKLETFGDADR